MKTYLNLILLFTFSLGILACSSDDDVYESDIVGTWYWESTGGGEAYQIFETPESQDRTLEIQLKENHDFIAIENGVQIAEGSFELTRKYSNLTEENERFIIVSIKTSDSLNDIIYEGIIYTYDDENRLVIREDFEEGVTSVFRRM